VRRTQKCYKQKLTQKIFERKFYKKKFASQVADDSAFFRVNSFSPFF